MSPDCFVIPGTLTSNTHPEILFPVTESIRNIQMKASSPVKANSGPRLKNFALRHTTVKFTLFTRFRQPFRLLL